MSPIRGHCAGISYLRRPGDGETLVLLHGIGSDAESWVPLIGALPGSVHVIAWDAPGYGDSEAVAQATPGAYADRLARLLDTLALDRVALVGHSLGSLFAGRFAVAHARRVSRLALLSPALGYGVAAGAALPAGVQARIDDLERLGPALFAEKRAERLVYRPETKPSVLAGVRRGMSGVRMPGYGQAVRALGAGALLDDAAKITAPTIVAVGEQDVVTPPANAVAVHDALPNGLGLHRVADCGHALPQEAPTTLAGLLMEAFDV